MNAAHLLLPALALGLSALAPAQTVGGVAPPSFSNQWGNGCNSGPWGVSQSRWQQVIERKSLPASLTPGKLISLVGLRRCNVDRDYSTYRLQTEMALYSVSFAKEEMSKTFADNRMNALGGTVFQRKRYSLPAIATNVDPAKAFVLLPLDSPHVFGGPNLMIEVVNEDFFPRTTLWSVDFSRSMPKGFAQQYGQGCGPATRLQFAGDFLPGSSATLVQSQGPADTPTVLFVGADNSSFRGLTLPFELSGVGAAGCRLLCGVDSQYARTLDATGSARVQLPFPNNPWLSARSFFAQWFNLDPTANGLGATATAGTQITLGPIESAMGYTFRHSDNMDTTGLGPFTGRGVIVRLIY